MRNCHEKLNQQSGPGNRRELDLYRRKYLCQSPMIGTNEDGLKTPCLRLLYSPYLDDNPCLDPATAPPIIVLVSLEQKRY